MKITLGKDLIECLSWSLYANPIVLFREAIQNSIDSFGTHSSEYSKIKIDAHLNVKDRSISITDNGPALGETEFVKNLTSLGESSKKGKAQAGCRGIGRLSGLGICDSITFESKQKDSKTANICVIHAKEIRDELTKPDKNDSKSIAEFLEPFFLFTKKESTSPNSYFKVTYQNVRHTPADFLLNPNSVSKYISSVIPVPIAESFPFKAEVENFYKEHNLPNDIKVSINEGHFVERGICSKSSKIKKSPSLKFECFDLKSPTNGEVLGSTWFIHHDYLGALEDSPFRGLRFRHKNLLIGNEDTFSHLYKEPRFNRWTVAEVHPLSDRIRPSVKRDDFEVSDYFSALCSQLRPHLFKVAQLARKSSATRVLSKTETKEKELKPFRMKLKATLNKKIPATLSKKRILRIADDIYCLGKGKIDIKAISNAFLKKGKD